MASNPDEQIVIRILLDTNQAIQDAQAFRQTVESVKEQIIKDAQASGLSIDDIGKAYLRLAKTIRDNKITALKEAFSNKDISAFNQAAGTSFTGAIDKSALVNAINAVRTEYANTTKQIQTGMREANAAQKEVEKGTKDLGGEAKNATSIFSNLGKAILAAFGITSVLQMVRQFIAYLKESIEAGKEFAQAQFNMSVGVRALQATGLSITMKDISEAIDQVRAKWGIFSRKELTEGMSQIVLMTREFGLSKEQILSLSDASATLAAIMGKDMTEAAKQITLAISSGYAEGLQRAGLNINKMEIANEAMRLGINKTYIAMSGQEKAAAALSLITRQLTAIYGDAITIQATNIGQYRKAAAEADNLKAAIGERLLPIQTAFQTVINDTTRYIYDLIVAWQELKTKFNITTEEKMSMEERQKFADLYVKTLTTQANAPAGKAAFAELTKAFPEFGKEVHQAAMMVKEAEDQIRDYIAAHKDMIDITQIPIHLRPIEGLGSILKDLSGETQTAEEQLSATLLQVQGDMYDKLLDLLSEYKQRSEDIETDRIRRIEEIDREGAQKQDDLWRDYYSRLIDLAYKYNADVQKEIDNYNLNVIQTNRQFDLRKADLARRYRENELKAERDFREKLRRLQEDFLFDLEDALRERDARQVLRLIKQYNLEKDRARRDFEAEREERRRQYRLELKELEEQRQERLRILAEEHAARMRELLAQYKREQELAEQNYKQRSEDLVAQMDRQKEEVNIKAGQALADLRKDFQARLEEFTTALAEQYGITVDMADKIIAALDAKFGKGSPVEKIYKNLNTMIDALIYRMAFLKSLADSLSGQTPKPPAPGSPQVPMAAGGTIYANKPTLVKFGEAGGEFAKFVPENRMGELLGVGNRFGNGGKIKLQVSLDPGLEASIVENTLSEMTQIVLDVQRKR